MSRKVLPILLLVAACRPLAVASSSLDPTGLGGGAGVAGSASDGGHGGDEPVAPGGGGGAGGVVVGGGGEGQAGAGGEVVPRAVYLLGTTQQGSCDHQAVQRVWPSLETGWRDGFACGADWFAFRADGTLFYDLSFVGIVQDVPGKGYEVVPTPPCDDRLGAITFGFDGRGRLHYACFDGVYRDGALIKGGILVILGVREDGGIIAAEFPERSDTAHWNLLVLAEDGSELSRFAINEEFEHDVVTSGAMVRGNEGWVGLLRATGRGDNEPIVLHVASDGVVTIARRLTPERAYAFLLPLPDGSVVLRRNGPKEFDVRIIDVDGGERTLWRMEDVARGGVVSHADLQLLPGP
jgi:hypothetical protein